MKARPLHTERIDRTLPESSAQVSALDLFQRLLADPLSPSLLVGWAAHLIELRREPDSQIFLAMAAPGAVLEKEQLLRLAKASKSVGDIVRAAGLAAAALRVDLECLEAWACLAQCLLDKAEPDLASGILTLAENIYPADPALLPLQARAASLRQDFTRAIDLMKSLPEVVQHEIDNGLILLEALQGQGRYEEAALLAEELGRDHPANASLANATALILSRTNRPAHALSVLRASLAREPLNPCTHFNLGCFLIQIGEWSEGWREFEWRWRLGSGTYRSHFRTSPPHREWRGTAIRRKRLLVHSEQGHGDNLQFMPFLQLVKERFGCKIIFMTYRPLLELARLIEAVDEVVVSGETLPAYDEHVSLCSLPMILDFRFEDLPRYHALLAFPISFPKCSSGPDPKIVINSSGNYLGNLDFRSISDERFLKILDTPGPRFFAINTDPDIIAHGVPLASHPNVTNLGSLVRDFAESAFVLRNADLVVTTDTSLAHLAGVMKVETWVLLPFEADWRWGDPSLPLGSPSPWYPSTLMFRQQSPRNWDSVFDEVERRFRDKFHISHDPDQSRCLQPDSPSSALMPLTL